MATSLLGCLFFKSFFQQLANKKYKQKDSKKRTSHQRFGPSYFVGALFTTIFKKIKEIVTENTCVITK